MKELKQFFEKWGFGIKEPPLLDTEITFIKKIPYFENTVCLCVAILKDKKYMLFTICETKCKWLDDTITEFVGCERYAEYRTFVKLYESDNEQLRQVAGEVGNFAYFKNFPQEYQCWYYIYKYLKGKEIKCN